MKIMKLAEYKHLLLNLKTQLKKLEKGSHKKIKELEELEDGIKKQKLKWTS